MVLEWVAGLVAAAKLSWDAYSKKADEITQRGKDEAYESDKELAYQELFKGNATNWAVVERVVVQAEERGDQTPVATEIRRVAVSHSPHRAGKPKKKSGPHRAAKKKAKAAPRKATKKAPKKAAPKKATKRKAAKPAKRKAKKATATKKFKKAGGGKKKAAKKATKKAPKRKLARRKAKKATRRRSSKR